MSLAIKNAFVITSLAIVSFATIYFVSPSLRNLSPVTLFDDPAFSLANISTDGVLVSLSLQNSSSITPLNDPTYTEAKNNSKDNDFYRHLINRRSNYSSWIIGPKNMTNQLRSEADKDGPIMDFIIAGFPKCGTTTMVANLAHIAPMPQKDVCAETLHAIVDKAYNIWPDEFNGEDMLYRGVKCPQMVHRKRMFPILPKAKIIIGIRHPVLWFQSFWNMQAAGDWKNYLNFSPYNRTQPCTGKEKRCNAGCPDQLYCIFRGRFHLILAQLGKTPLTRRERTLLAPNDRDGGKNITIQRVVKNPLFIYEMNQLKEDYLWEELSQFLNYHNGTIPHDRYKSSHGSINHIPEEFRDKINYLDVCEPQYDQFRAIMMPYAYEMSRWICGYFVRNDRPNDVKAPRRGEFCKIVSGYRKDPCGRLRRTQNGIYILDVEKDQSKSNVTMPERK